MHNENSADPREGVRFAYLISNPLHNDQDFEDWWEKNEPSDGELGPHELFASICKDAILSKTEIKGYQERSICFAGGYHTAMSHIAVALDYVTSKHEQSRCSSRHEEEQPSGKKNRPKD